jgi:hypothetical protein
MFHAGHRTPSQGRELPMNVRLALVLGIILLAVGAVFHEGQKAEGRVQEAQSLVETATRMTLRRIEPRLRPVPNATRWYQPECLVGIRRLSSSQGRGCS